MGEQDSGRIGALLVLLPDSGSRQKSAEKRDHSSLEPYVHNGEATR
jgi:hypothetical protein